MNELFRSSRGVVAALIALLLVLAGCGSDDDNAPPAATGTVSGTVVASGTGLPLAAVAVNSAGRSTTTAADGSYTLPDVPAGEAVVAFDLANHARGIATVSVTASATARADVRLTPVGARQSFDAATAATVTVPSSTARVSLPAAGLVTASGAPASGTVTADLTPIDPASDPRNMPGNYTAVAAGSGVRQSIESFGAINVVLKDAAGNALNLAAGKTATIRIPLSTRSPNPPATVPLYYFNEATGLWVEEGTAALAGTAPDRYYEGTVSHFTYWNADQPADTIEVIGCVQDAAGARVANAVVTTYGSDYSGSASAYSDAGGGFRVAMRKASVATVVAQLGNRASNAVRAGPSNVDITLPACLVLSAGGSAPQIVVQPESVTSQAGGYAYLRVEAIGSPTLRYQWRRNGTDIAGAVGSTLLVYPLQATDNAASYTVVVGNAYGSATSDAAVITVSTAALPPLITAQPQPQSVSAGASATFSVAAASQGGALSYQWQRNGAPISGATGTSYSTPPAALADSGAVYRVVVTSSNGTSTTSSGATLTVAAPAPLAIGAQPQSVSVNVGQSASFNVTVTGGTATPSYQWRRNGVAIAGATAAGYTTPPTALADNGAVYSVVVSSGTESVTSSGATLTVTQPAGGNGYYLLASAGPVASGTVTFANGVQTLSTPALLAVNTAAPGGGAVTVEPAGQTFFLFSSAIEGTVSGGQVSNLRSRLAVYFKGGRLYTVDQVVANGAVPTPQLVSSLASTDVCGSNGAPLVGSLGSGNDFANPRRSWTFLRAPGADGQCNTADDAYRAVRLDMAATDAALTVAEPQVEILAADGSLAGVVVHNGSQMQRLDANLANPVNLFTVAAAGYTNFGLTFGSAAPGFWLFVEGGRLWGVNLATPSARVELATLAAGEVASRTQIVSDGGAAFVALGSTSGTRVLRVSEGLAVTPVATLTQPLTQLGLTPTRVAMLTQGAPVRVLSVPKSGGTPTQLYTFDSNLSPSHLVASGENVYVAQSQVTASGGSVSTLVVGSDGSNPQTLANTKLLGGIAPASQPLVIGLDTVYAVLLADGVKSLLSDAGATLRTLEGASRSPLVTYGSLPALPDGVLYQATVDPFHYGQSGLFGLIPSSGGGSSYGDLFHFKSDAAGLTKATNFSSVTPSQASPARRASALAAKRAGAAR